MLPPDTDKPRTAKQQAEALEGLEIWLGHHDLCLTCNAEENDQCQPVGIAMVTHRKTGHTLGRRAVGHPERFLYNLEQQPSQRRHGILRQLARFWEKNPMRTDAVLLDPKLGPTAQRNYVFPPDEIRSHREDMTFDWRRYYLTHRPPQPLEF